MLVMVCRVSTMVSTIYNSWQRVIVATTKGTEHNPVIGDLAISTDISNVIIDSNFGIGPRRAL
eukprot:COSAG02_NODE_65934_length_256_cov_2.808917_1_plen_62_part_01